MSTSEGRTCITHHVVHKTVKQAQRTHCSGMKFYLLLVCHTLWGGRRSIRAIKSRQIFNSIHKRMSLLQKIISNKNKLKLATGKWSLKYPWLSSQGIYFHHKMFLIFLRFPNAGIFLVPSSRVCSAGLIWDFLDYVFQPKTCNPAWAQAHAAAVTSTSPRLQRVRISEIIDFESLHFW